MISHGFCHNLYFVDRTYENIPFRNFYPYFLVVFFSYIYFSHNLSMDGKNDIFMASSCLSSYAWMKSDDGGGDYSVVFQQKEMNPLIYKSFTHWLYSYLSELFIFI